jgi:hypothetical protein
MTFLVHYLRCSPMSQRMKANKESLEHLAPRVHKLAEFLCAPIGEGDTKEQDRRDQLGR